MYSTTPSQLEIVGSIVTDDFFLIVKCNFSFLCLMTCNYQKSTKQLLTASSFALLMLFSGIYGIPHAFAETENDFIIAATDRIKNDPFLVKILENMEKSKKEFSDIQQQSAQEKLLDDQRSITKSMLEKELQQMFKDNEDFTPLSSFKRFLDKVSDDKTKIIFQGLFDYQQEKVDTARNAMKEVFKNGGSLIDARNAYHEAAKIPRVDMIQLVEDLNIEVGFADPKIQQNFNSEGKLPRFDDESESVLSFVDYTTSSPNVNSSPNNSTSETVQSLDENVNTNENDDSNKTTIQKLLDEIELLKNKIRYLEQQQDETVYQTVLESRKHDSLYFANWILDYSQGKGHYDSKVRDMQSIPVNALNEPNSFTNISNSLSLGRQGQVTLGFSDPVVGKLIVYEASGEPTIRELATVEVSADGQNWILLKQTQYHNDGSKVHEYGYDLSDVGCITHVRITDNAPSTWGDGFDVDAVAATQTCANTT